MLGIFHLGAIRCLEKQLDCGGNQGTQVHEIHKLYLIVLLEKKTTMPLTLASFGFSVHPRKGCVIYQCSE